MICRVMDTIGGNGNIGELSKITIRFKVSDPSTCLSYIHKK